MAKKILAVHIRRYSTLLPKHRDKQTQISTGSPGNLALVKYNLRTSSQVWQNTQHDLAHASSQHFACISLSCCTQTALADREGKRKGGEVKGAGEATQHAGKFRNLRIWCSICPEGTSVQGQKKERTDVINVLHLQSKPEYIVMGASSSPILLCM